LANKKIKYLVIGGVAVNLHGFYRATGDLDIILFFNKTNLNKFITMAKALGLKPGVPVKIEELADVAKRQKWVKEKHMKVFSLYNPADPIEHIDIMVVKYIDFDQAYKRRQEVCADKIKIPLISINDLIVLKKKAGRERDKIDIKALMKIRELKNESEKERKKRR